MSGVRFIVVMVIIVILALLMAVTMPARGQSHLPPARYDYPTDNMDVRIMPLAEVQRKCAILARIGVGVFDSRLIQGCALPGLTPCIVLLPPNAPDWVYRHERAHCNGWRH